MFGHTKESIFPRKEVALFKQVDCKEGERFFFKIVSNKHEQSRLFLDPSIEQKSKSKQTGGNLAGAPRTGLHSVKKLYNCRSWSLAVLAGIT